MSIRFGISQTLYNQAGSSQGHKEGLEAGDVLFLCLGVGHIPCSSFLFFFSIYFY